MADTTGNQSLVIVTDGTSHTSTTLGPTDVCKLPNNVPAPFPNFIMSSSHVQSGTTNTLIQNKVVMLQGSNLGPTSNPPHAGVNKGVVSGTYIDIAEPTSWSKDVKNEGQPVIRSNDPTTQNSGNTAGTMAGGAKQPVLKAADDNAGKQCFMSKLDGISAPESRLLGPPPGVKGKGVENNYLEIREDSNVTFTSERKDVILNVVDPGCLKTIHTEWIVTETDGEGKTEKKTKKAAKTYKHKGKRLEAEPIPKAGVAETRNYKTGDQRAFSTPTGQAMKQEAASFANAYNAVTGLYKAVKWYEDGKKPSVVTVQAWACSGSKTATLKVFPGDVDVDLFSFDKYLQRIQKAKKVSELASKIAGALGIPFEITLLKECKAQFVGNYKELKKDFQPPPRFGFTFAPVYRVQCRRRWTLEFSANPLVGAKVKASMPLANFIGVVGALAAKALGKLGIKADVFIALELKITPKVRVGWSEYDEIDVGGDCKVSLTFSAGLELKAVIAEASILGYIEGSVKFDHWGPHPSGAWLACKVSGEVQLGIKGAAKVNLYLLTAEADFNWKPVWLKTGSPTPVDMTVVPAPSGG